MIELYHSIPQIILVPYIISFMNGLSLIPMYSFILFSHVSIMYILIAEVVQGTTSVPFNSCAWECDAIVHMSQWLPWDVFCNRWLANPWCSEDYSLGFLLVQESNLASMQLWMSYIWRRFSENINTNKTNYQWSVLLCWLREHCWFALIATNICIIIKQLRLCFLQILAEHQCRLQQINTETTLCIKRMYRWSSNTTS